MMNLLVSLIVRLTDNVSSSCSNVNWILLLTLPSGHRCRDSRSGANSASRSATSARLLLLSRKWCLFLILYNEHKMPAHEVLLKYLRYFFLFFFFLSCTQQTTAERHVTSTWLVVPRKLSFEFVNFISSIWKIFFVIGQHRPRAIDIYTVYSRHACRRSVFLMFSGYLFLIGGCLSCPSTGCTGFLHTP